MAYNCNTVDSLYKDLPFCKGAVSLPGMRSYVYGISKRDIVKYPTMKGLTATGLKDAVTYDGEFTLAAGKKWHKVGTIKDEGQLQVESQGTYGSRTFKNTLTFAIPGTEEEATGYISEMNNDEMVFIAVMRGNKARVIGSEDFTPELTLSQDSGKAATDTNSTSVQAECTDMYPAPFYTGKIETDDGDVQYGQ